MQRVPVSVLLITLNEERHIRAILENVSWADDVHVVDSGTDRTAAIAREYTKNVHQVEFGKIDQAGPKLNWAVENIPFAHEWVLFLHADDRIPDALVKEIAEKLPTTRFDGFLISQRYVFMGRPLLHCRGPLYQLKLAKHRMYRNDETMHTVPIFSGRVGYLKNYYIQNDERTIYQYLDRHNNYTTREAEVYGRLRAQPLDLSLSRFLLGHDVIRKQMLKRLWVRLPARPLILFLWIYFVRGGFLDGPHGLIFALLRGAGYEFLVDIKTWEWDNTARHKGSDPN